MNKKLLTTAIAVTFLALICLLAYSIERTAWLFGEFETWWPAAYAAAIVIELSAVALIVGAGALAHLDAKARAWANRALAAVLSVGALANLSAGFLRGGRSLGALFGPADDWATYAVAASLWLTTNLAVPALIFFLSKLLERLVSALARPTTTARRRRQVHTLIGLLRTWRDQLATLRADLATAHEQLAAARADLANRDATLASATMDAAASRESLAAQSREAQRLREQIATLRDAPPIIREPPPTQARIIAYVREQMAQHSRSLLDISRELGISESTIRGWLKVGTNGHLVEG